MKTNENERKTMKIYENQWKIPFKLGFGKESTKFAQAAATTNDLLLLRAESADP